LCIHNLARARRINQVKVNSQNKREVFASFIFLKIMLFESIKGGDAAKRNQRENMFKSMFK